MHVSYYKNVKDNEGKTAQIHLILQAIGNGRWSKSIGDIRQAISDGNQSKADTLKKMLPAVIFSGIFSKRSANGLEDGTYTNIITIDIDAKAEQVSDQFAKKGITPAGMVAKVAEDQHTFASFVSPSGNGIKILALSSLGPEHHLRSFKWIKSYYENLTGLEIDPSGKDISRLCFVSNDPDVYFNQEAAPFTIPKPEDEQKERDRYRIDNKEKLSDDLDYQFKVCQKFVEKKNTFNEGNRNNYIHHLACTMNRAGISLNDAMTLALVNYYGISEQEITYTVEHAYLNNAQEHGSFPIYEYGSKNNIKRGSNISQMDTYQRYIYRKAYDLSSKGVNTDEIKRLLYYDYRVQHIDRKIETDEVNFQQSVLGAIRDFEAENIRQIEKATSTTSASEAFDDAEENIFSSKYISSFIEPFDKAMRGGFRRGDSYAFVGPEKSTKSWFAMHMLTENAKAGIPGLYVCAEVSKAQFTEKMISKEFNIDVRAEVQAGTLSRERFRELTKAIEDRLGGNMYTNFSAGLSCVEILEEKERIEKLHNTEICFIVVDGISHLDTNGLGEIPGAIENSALLKELAKESNTAVIFISHTNGEAQDHFRAQYKFIRGGKKVKGNIDGSISMSRIIDVDASNLTNKEYRYKNDTFWYMLNDERNSGQVRDCLIGIRNGQVQPLDIDPDQFENALQDSIKRKLSNAYL